MSLIVNQNIYDIWRPKAENFHNYSSQITEAINNLQRMKDKALNALKIHQSQRRNTHEKIGLIVTKFINLRFLKQ